MTDMHVNSIFGFLYKNRLFAPVGTRPVPSENFPHIPEKRPEFTPNSQGLPARTDNLGIGHRVS